ncbi:class I SAM-dependent methyltransferase [Desulfoferrobacter suflitae]|uniref:class I SAM-dependent methyltransferase n=1 Tax=Desulfoferrobacter suflitae TaxID=2865782 RepID=UPI0021648D46|nr:class I SAM-dependent methyltransferase [Desulfoferrobacter suflitae]MCK8601000.1 class I SAM-dependent methyltransferase [Desulfoferrobacter suflitae]
MAEKTAYSQAFHSGRYDKASGLLGKYDNVRRFWEDQVTSIFLRPALNDLVENKRKRLERLRVLDLGCGSGDGFDLIMGVTTKDPGIYEYITAALTDDMLKEYVGLDLNEDLLRQAEEYYGQAPKMRFVQGDLTHGLPPQIMQEEEPFDFYFTSYGTLSHFHDHQAVDLVADISKHAPHKAIVMLDWLGRYTYEWQNLWHHPVDQEYFMDYRISYIYPEDQRDKVEVASFPLRLMSRDEIMKIVAEASRKSGVQVKPLVFFDRSIFIGRHMDTGDYNKNCPKLRGPVNSLFESYVRTDLESLFVNYVPRQGFAPINNFFEMFFMSCNALVEYTISLLSKYSCDTATFQSPPAQVLPYYPEPLKEAMHTMRRVVEGVGWVKFGDARANMIESHLAYSLRKLEMELQPGTGMGHGLVGIFEINK